MVYGYYGFMRNTYSGGSFSITSYVESLITQYIAKEIFSAGMYSGSLCSISVKLITIDHSSDYEISSPQGIRLK